MANSGLNDHQNRSILAEMGSNCHSSALCGLVRGGEKKKKREKEEEDEKTQKKKWMEEE